MPAVPSTNKFANRQIRHCAREGAMMVMRCNSCRRTVHYWAADLLQVIDDPFHEAHVPIWPCARCGTIEYMVMRWMLPTAQELEDGITVRRPVKKITKWIWKNERA